MSTMNRRAHELIRTAPASDQFPWWEWHIRENRVVASPRKAGMLGYDPREFEDAGFEAYTSLLHPDDYERTMEAMRAYLRGDASLYQIDYRIRTADGDYVWYVDRGIAVERDADGHPAVIRGIVISLGRAMRERALDETLVEALRASLPDAGASRRARICPQCGRLQIEDGAWVEVAESLIEGLHGDVRHTLCETCITRLYPDTAERVLARLRLDQTRAIRVALLAPARLVRELLVSQFDREESIDLVAAVESDSKLLEALELRRVDVAVLSADGPDSGVVGLIRQVRESHPSIDLVAYCLCHRDVFAVRALRAGARGFVDGAGSVSEFVRAVHTVAAGGLHIASRAGERVVSDSISADAPPHRELSDREFQILILIARQQTGRAIAESLNLSESTVATHRSHVLAKLGLGSTADLTRYAVDHALVTPDELV